MEFGDKIGECENCFVEGIEVRKSLALNQDLCESCYEWQAEPLNIE